MMVRPCICFLMVIRLQVHFPELTNRMIAKKFDFTFRMVVDSPAVDSTGDFEILAHFLMYWDNPISIVSDLVPLINRGIIYGRQERWMTYEDIPGLKEKMLRQWEVHNISNGVERWEKIRSWKGYYIKEEDSFLESIGADIVGSAFVTSDTTVINGSDLKLKDIEISSYDFKEVVLEWLQFILRNKMTLPKGSIA